MTGILGVVVVVGCRGYCAGDVFFFFLSVTVAVNAVSVAVDMVVLAVDVVNDTGGCITDS